MIGGINMTRGYYVILNKKNKVEKVAYLSSDAYLSYYGLLILRSINDCKVNTFMSNLIDKNIEYGCEDDLDGFQLNWIKPNKESRQCEDWNYSEYGYIFNGDNLKVYCFGKLLLTVDCNTQEEIDKYLYIFENEDDIYSAISYDEYKLDNVIPFEKVIKQAVKMNLDELKLMVFKSRGEERFYLSDSHCIASGYRADREVYQKRLTSSCGNESLKFIVEHDMIGYTDYGWKVLIQTPVVRVPITISRKKFNSEKALMNALRDFIRPRKNKLMQLAFVINKFEEAKRNDMMKTFISELDGLWSNANWFVGDGRSLTKEWFRREAENILYIQKPKLVKAE